MVRGLPAAIGETLAILMQRVEGLEQLLGGNEDNMPWLHVPDHCMWRGKDFSI